MKDSNDKEIPSGDMLPLSRVFDLKNVSSPVHVAVICPPGAAVTALLNKMGDKGGMFVLLQSIPMQVGALSKSNGQSNIQVFPLLIFAIQKKAFESWMKCTYEAVAMYNMDDIMQDCIRDQGINPRMN